MHPVHLLAIIAATGTVPLRILLHQSVHIESTEGRFREPCDKVDEEGCVGGTAAVSAFMRGQEDGADEVIRLVGYDSSKLVYFHPKNFSVNNDNWGKLGADVALLMAPRFQTQEALWEDIQKWLGSSTVPLLNSNLGYDGTNPEVMQFFPYLHRSVTIRTKAGYTIGILGLYGANIYVPFYPIRAAALNIATSLKRQGVHHVIAVCMGETAYWPEDGWRDLIGAVDTIVQVGCNECTGGPAQDVGNGTWLLPAVDSGSTKEGQDGTAIGVLDFIEENGRLKPKAASYVSVMQPVPPALNDSTFREDVEWLQGVVNGALGNDPVLGTAGAVMPDGRVMSTQTAGEVTDEVCWRDRCQLGVWATGVVHEKFADLDIVLINGGSFKFGWDPGPLTSRQLYEAMPYRNYICTFKTTGPDLWRIIARYVENPNPDGSYNINAANRGAFPQLSGMRFTYDPSRPEGDKVLGVEVFSRELQIWEPLQRGRFYTVATISFLCSGGDDYDFYKIQGSERTYADTTQELAVDWIARRVQVFPPSSIGTSVVFDQTIPTFRLAEKGIDECSVTERYEAEYRDCIECPPGSVRHPTDPTDCTLKSDSSDGSWVYGVVAAGIVLLVVGPAVLIYTTRNWRKMRKMRSADEIATRCARSIAKLEFEEVEYIRDIRNPNDMQSAFIDIIDILTEYRAFFPQTVLMAQEDPDAGGSMSPLEELDLQVADIADAANAPLNPLRVKRHSIVESIPGSEESKSSVGSSTRSGASGKKSHLIRQGSNLTRQIHNTGQLAIGEFKGRRGSVVCGQLITGQDADERKQIAQGQLFVAAAVDTCRKLKGVTTVVADWDGALSVMLSWNAHMPCSSHAYNACELALNLVDELTPIPDMASAFPCIAVASGKLWFGNVGTAMQRFPCLAGSPVGLSCAMAKLCEQVACPALCHAAVYEQVRSRVRARVVDATNVGGREDLIYELMRGQHPEKHGLYVEGFSSVRTSNFEEAVTNFRKYLQYEAGDRQALRLLRLSTFLKTGDRFKEEQYARGSQPRWVPYEVLTRGVILPEDKGEEIAARQAWTASVSGTGDSHRAGTESESDDASMMMDQVHKAVQLRVENSGDGKLPIRFTDSRGRGYHRSKRCLGRGAFGEVWLGMGADGGMVAVKSIKIMLEGQAQPNMDVSPSTLGNDGTQQEEEDDGGDDWTCSPSQPEASAWTCTPSQPEPGATTGGVSKTDVTAISPQTKRQLQEMVQEVQFMSQMQHENIVQYLGCAVTEAFVLICMEYLPGGSLAGVLQQFDGALPESSVVRFVRDIIRGLEFIHKQNIVHRDLKPANVLMTVDGVCKLADFGASAELKSAAGDGDGGPIGTPMYMPPEQANGMATQVSDIWSLGIVVVELCTGSVPWERPNNILAFIHNLGKPDGPTPVVPDGMPPKAKQLAESCLQREQNKRPRAKNLLSHPYILS
eukprot:Hpha_TRINITY_DN15310_c1_g5::TRINITY_DN15310_c1_g5_i1::g.91316::m.91316